MMSETLAEYSALKVMEKKYGEENMRKYLRYELDRYLRGRAGEVRHEPPLALVQNEPYVWYYKGALVMFALSDYIGEDKLNAALRGYPGQEPLCDGAVSRHARICAGDAGRDAAGAAIYGGRYVRVDRVVREQGGIGDVRVHAGEAGNIK